MVNKEVQNRHRSQLTAVFNSPSRDRHWEMHKGSNVSVPGVGRYNPKPVLPGSIMATINEDGKFGAGQK